MAIKIRGLLAIKIRGLQNTYARSVGGGKFVIFEKGEKTGRTHTVSKPVTREQAKRVLGMTIPKKRR